ncbi:MAG: hypothetical protein Q8O64_13635 [Sideroxyarcus sp.]|nr:hypothetical protein [Sideroxyarcus sp.]
MTTVDSRFPKEIHALWATLDKEITWLHGRWFIYRQLYGTSPERVELLNKSAGSFINILQEILLHDVQLTLSKLDDPATSGRSPKIQKNMTLDALHKGLSVAGEVALADKMTASLQQFTDACTKIRTRRNKWIAHFDLPTMLNQDVHPRENPSRDEVENALKALRDVMDCVSVHYTNTSIGLGYEHYWMQADGEALLHVLRCGLRYRELVEADVIPQDDYRELFHGKV